MAALLLMLGAAVAWLPAAARAQAAGCAAPDAVWRQPPSLDAWPHLVSLDAEALVIVALGSSSTSGVGASGPAATYPAKLEILLRQGLPGRQVRVLNRGIPGDTIERNLARLDADVLALGPRLVIWQVGTNDGLNGIRPGIVAGELRAGIARLRAAGAAVVLMEPQYLPERADDAGLDSVIAAIREVAQASGTPLIRRIDLMRYWLETHALTPDELLGRDGLHMTDASYACLAETVARAIGVLPGGARP